MEIIYIGISQKKRIRTDSGYSWAFVAPTNNL